MIIFLYGEDEFRSLEKLAEIKQKFLEKNRGSFALDVFDFFDNARDVDEFVARTLTGGLFSSKKLVIVKNILASKIGSENEILSNFLKDKRQAESKDLIVVFWEPEIIDRKNGIFKLLAKISKSQEFLYLSGAKLSSWITNKIRDISGGPVLIENGAAQRLAAYVGGDMFLLSEEIKKLVNYTKEGEIQVQDIELLVRSGLENDIFKTVDALGQRDKKEALRLFHNHIESGDDPFYLLSMYFFQFRNLLKVKKYSEENIAPQTISTRLKMHPFVARKSIEQAKKFSFDKLKKLYQILCDIDYRAKTGKTDIILALDMFVAMV